MPPAGYSRIFMKKVKLLLLSLFIALIPSSFVHAESVSDLSVTYDTTPTAGDHVFPTCTDSSCLSQYSYVIVDVSSPSYGSYRLRSLFDFGNFNYLNIATASGIYTLPASISQFKFYSGADLASYPWSSGITFTLTQSLSGSGIIPTGNLDITTNGTYNVTNYASVTVATDPELPPYSELVVDSFWKYHTAFAGSIVAIIAIFLVYRVIKGRLR